MKLSGARADSFVKAPPQDSLGVLFYGPDQGLCSERAGEIAKKFTDNPDDPFSVTSLNADDLVGDPARLSDEMSAMSLLGDTRLIRLRLSHERSGAAIAKAIKALDAAPHTSASKLIVEAGDLSPRSAVRKCFESAVHFTAIACYADTQATLNTLVKSELSALGIGIDRDALDAFVPLLEGDRRLARGEIEKMALYKGYGQIEGAKIELADVKLLAAGAGSTGIDDIVFDTLSGNPLDADAGFQRAMEGKLTAHSILFSLQRHLIRLHQASSLMASGQSPDDAMRSLRPPVFMMRKNAFSHQLRLWPENVLMRAISSSLELEKQMKSTGAPVESLMGRLLLSLASYAAKRKR
ncbi:MAG: DNA polymerase III subunit delta [Robiginitomaculum sp.]|nr:MAG: DNA polymerase III subunit delta [Robiginitomaculum sp.]